MLAVHAYVQGRLAISCFLEDRALMTTCILLLEIVLDLTSQYDETVGFSNNEGKTQLYAATASNFDRFRVVYPGGQRRCRPWLLGAPLDLAGERLSSDAATLAKTEARVTSALSLLQSAAALPFDLRCRTLAVMWTPTYNYAVAFQPHTRATTSKLVSAFQACMLGKRSGAQQLILP